MLDDPVALYIFQQNGFKRWEKNGKDRLYCNIYKWDGVYIDLVTGDGYDADDFIAYFRKIKQRAEQAHTPHQVDLDDSELMEYLGNVCIRLWDLLQSMERSLPAHVVAPVKKYAEACTPTDIITVFGGIKTNSDPCWLGKRLQEVKVVKPWLENQSAWDDFAKTIPDKQD